MVLHVRAIHPDLMLHLDNAMAHSLTLGEGHARPCKACGAAPRGRHRCRVLHQLCLKLHYSRCTQVLQPLMAHLTKNFEAPSNLSPSQQAALDVANVLGEAAAALADSEMPPPSALGKRQDDLQDRPATKKPAGKGNGQGQSQPKVRRTTVLWNRGSGWSKQQRRKDLDNRGQETDWQQSQELKELRQQVGALQEHVRLLARMSLRLLAYLRASERGDGPRIDEYAPSSVQDGGCLEGKEGERRGGLQPQTGAVPGLGSAVHQADHDGQLATLKFLRQKDGGTKMEWPYLRWNQEREILEPRPSITRSS